MISVCLPTRGRPNRFATAVGSALATAQGEVEVVAWVDEDDPELERYLAQAAPRVRILSGPREIQSNLWNRCWEVAGGDIAMLAADDIVFKTRGWDVRVARAFEQWPDRIGMAYGDDGSRRREATLPFVSREWIEAAGTFTPPYFKSWFADRWIWEIAAMLNRSAFLRQVVIEHRHPVHGKAPQDQTYRDGATFRAEQDPQTLYLSPRMLAERLGQALRLCERIDAVAVA